MGIQSLLIAGSGTYIAGATDYDGATYDAWTGVPTGVVDGQKGTISIWHRADSDAAIDTYIGTDLITGAHFKVTRTTNGKINFNWSNSVGVNRGQKITTATYLSGSGWHHILASWDFGVPNFKLWIDDVQITAYDTSSQTASTIDYDDTGNWRYAQVNGCMGQFWFDPTSALDIDNSTVRRKFVTSGVKPVYLGVNGEIPTGASPIIFFVDGNGVTNSGTGGNAVVSGSGKAVCSSVP